ncbi:MAG: low temperature requirement protein A [Actinomycetota bacterium]|nr:low temperature requirement protein A [Actinomycetota bacterium]
MTELQSVRGGTDRNASTIELFFDLVYVFAITQVVAFIHGDPSVFPLAAGAFLLGLLWWTWSIYAWTTNWAGTDTTPIKLFLLAAMGTTLLMALAVPNAFGEGSEWFGITYFIVRILAAGFYWVASKRFPEQRAAFFTFFPMSFAAAFLVLVGGFLDAPWLGVLWIAGAALDVVSALNAGKGTWAVDARHFAERNGLFVIIALGESIVGIGLTAAHEPLTTVLIPTVGVTFVVAAALWWSYFDRAAPHAEAYFLRAEGKEPGRFARDVYSVLHYPLVIGIVFFAVSAEDVIAHPTDPLTHTSRLAMSLGVTLVLLSIAAVAFRATRYVAIDRLLAAAALMLLGWLGGGLTAGAFTTIVAAILIITMTWEHFHPWAPVTEEHQRNADPA